MLGISSVQISLAGLCLTHVCPSLSSDKPEVTLQLKGRQCSAGLADNKYHGEETGDTHSLSSYPALLYQDEEEERVLI